MNLENPIENQNDLFLTERRNENSLEIDKKDTENIINIINEEDFKVPEAIEEIRDCLSNFIEDVSWRIKKGGRLIYVGAGTSGRMGVIDAVECEPTFSLEDKRIKGIIAGGKEAMFKAKEGLEDDFSKGRERMLKENLTDLDTVLGISASGRTPYVLGAIKESKKYGSLTGALVSNYNTKIGAAAEYELEVVVGPEILTGSTRMKAAAAQKMVLHTISTTLMIKLGKVYSNLMVDLKVTNKKLQKRAINIFCEVTKASRNAAKDFLEKADYRVKPAIVMYEKNTSFEEALKTLENNEGKLREVIG